MHSAQDYYPDCPEAMIVGFAQKGDHRAFEELVRRRQSAIRNLMRRCCGDEALADDLAQQVFLQVWLKIRSLREIKAFGVWLRRLAVSVWLQHQRKGDALRGAGEIVETELVLHDSPGLGMDLDQALAALPGQVRLCIVLSYNEGMSHGEIAELTSFPLGTVKSHINRGTNRLRQSLAAYQDKPDVENS